MPAPSKPTYLILVKHSLPEIRPDQPANRWQLSPEGRARCSPLADKLAHYEPHAILSSLEPKAIETASLVGEHLDLPIQSIPGLHEHKREQVPFRSKAKFESSVARFFENPKELVFGEETAAQAAERFSVAIISALAERPSQNLVVVAHGTVISLFVARHNPIAPYPFWLRLGLPSVVILSRPELKLLSVTEEFSPPPNNA